jgi:hypothetical protein
MEGSYVDPTLLPRLSQMNVISLSVKDHELAHANLACMHACTAIAETSPLHPDSSCLQNRL